MKHLEVVELSLEIRRSKGQYVNYLWRINRLNSIELV